MSVLTRAMTSCSNARIFIVNSTDIVNEAIRIHSLSPTAAAALGRTLTACSMMGSMLKDKDNSVTVNFRGDGACGSILAVSDYYGNVRGYAERPNVDLPRNSLGKIDVASAVGKGTLCVIKDVGEKEPYVGMTEIVSGEIGEDITSYFASSEQIPTACGLGVLVGKDGLCIAAGGFMVQLMPFAEDAFITRLENCINSLPTVSALFNKGLDNCEILKEILKDIEFDVFDEIDVAYKCSCSEKKVRSTLASLGKEEITKMIAEGKDVEVSCQFCDNVYTFTEQNLIELLNEMRK